MTLSLLLEVSIYVLVQGKVIYSLCHLRVLIQYMTQTPYPQFCLAKGQLIKNLSAVLLLYSYCLFSYGCPSQQLQLHHQQRLGHQSHSLKK